MGVSINFIRVIMLAFIFLNAGIVHVFGQKETKKEEIVCFCKTRGQSPDNIITLDNNIDLIKLLSFPTLKANLVSKLTITESQLQLLEEWQLINNNGDSLQSKVLYLDSVLTKELRSLSRQFAGKIIREILPDIKRLNQYLSESGRSDNLYSILFSYILDGKVWDRLEDLSLVNKRELSEKNPFWNGEFWILENKRKFTCGTNKIKDNGVSFYVNWSNSAIPHMWDFFGNWESFGKLFDDITAYGIVKNDTVFKIFAKYGIFDDTGMLTIPVINESPGNPLSDIASKISEKICSQLSIIINSSDLQNFPFRDEKESLVILYHEILWDIMDKLVEQKIIRLPALFQNTGHADEINASELIFIVLKDKKNI